MTSLAPGFPNNVRTLAGLLATPKGKRQDAEPAHYSEDGVAHA